MTIATSDRCRGTAQSTARTAQPFQHQIRFTARSAGRHSLAETRIQTQTSTQTRAQVHTRAQPRVPAATADQSVTRTIARAAAAAGPWPARLLIGAALAMVPWLFCLAALLPATATAAHWNAVWVGLDAAEALGLLATGLLLRRGDPRRALTAACTATLLAVDAWFDCGTAARGFDRLTALLMAVGVEIPLAVLLAVAAWRALPKQSE